MLDPFKVKMFMKKVLKLPLKLLNDAYMVETIPISEKSFVGLVVDKIKWDGLMLLVLTCSTWVSAFRHLMTFDDWGFKYCGFCLHFTNSFHNFSKVIHFQNNKNYLLDAPISMLSITKWFLLKIFCRFPLHFRTFKIMSNLSNAGNVSIYPCL